MTLGMIELWGDIQEQHTSEGHSDERAKSVSGESRGSRVSNSEQLLSYCGVREGAAGCGAVNCEIHCPFFVGVEVGSR